MSKLILDCPLKKGERAPLEEAFSSAFECDVPAVLELLFVSEEEIRSLNKEKRGVDSVTDVLSFPAMELAAGEPICAAAHADCVEPIMGRRKGEWVETGERIYLGSVVICTKRAHEQAEEYGHSYEREVAYLAAHGLLHCLGYDHMEEGEKRVMRQKEEQLMQKLGLGREE